MSKKPKPLPSVAVQFKFGDGQGETTAPPWIGDGQIHSLPAEAVFLQQHELAVRDKIGAEKALDEYHALQAQRDGALDPVERQQLLDKMVAAGNRHVQMKKAYESSHARLENTLRELMGHMARDIARSKASAAALQNEPDGYRALFKQVAEKLQADDRKLTPTAIKHAWPRDKEEPSRSRLAELLKEWRAAPW